MSHLNELGGRLRDVLLAKHPEWAVYVNVLEGGDIEVAIPAPPGSRAGHLVVFTARGQGIWVRYAPPRMCYAVESEHELHLVVEALLTDDAFFVVITSGEEWIETGLYRPGEAPVLGPGQVANAVSWSGRHDKIVTTVAR